MGFFLQIIYLNGFVLKLFILWVSFYTTRRFSIGRVPQNGDTWHELRSGGLSDVVACQARPDVVACHSAKRGHTCWSTRRDHTCWSARYFLSRLPIKLLLLLLRSICTTKSLKWFTLSWVSFLVVVCIIVEVFYIYQLEILLKTSKCFYLWYIIALFNIYSVDDNNDYIL